MHLSPIHITRRSNHEVHDRRRNRLFYYRQEEPNANSTKFAQPPIVPSFTKALNKDVLIRRVFLDSGIA